MSVKLYELTKEFSMLVDIEPDDDGIISEDVYERLDELEIDILVKIEAVARAIKCVEAEAKAYKAEADRMAKQAAARNNHVTRMKNYIKENMDAIGIVEVDGVPKVKLQKNSVPSIEVVCMEDIPEDYTELVVERKVLKKAILDAYKKFDWTAPGCVITQGKHVRIY